MAQRHVLLILLAPVALLACSGSNEAEQAIRRGMLDPGAAQFRDVHRCAGDRTVWRGEVNGKNGFGAYTGFKSFFYSERGVTYLDGYAALEMIERCHGADKHPPPASKAAPSVTAMPSAPKPKPAAISSTDDFDSETEGPGRPNLAAPDQCWADYCPCDTSDPDYGYADIPLCRNMRMGLPVEDGFMAGGAAARDARRALREDQERNGSYGE